YHESAVVSARIVPEVGRGAEVGYVNQIIIPLYVPSPFVEVGRRGRGRRGLRLRLRFARPRPHGLCGVRRLRRALQTCAPLKGEPDSESPFSVIATHKVQVIIRPTESFGACGHVPDVLEE